ncbi:hypothetical protein ACFE04_021639 [Oxalis oulophora]
MGEIRLLLWLGRGRAAVDCGWEEDARLLIAENGGAEEVHLVSGEEWLGRERSWEEEVAGQRRGKCDLPCLGREWTWDETIVRGLAGKGPISYQLVPAILVSEKKARASCASKGNISYFETSGKEGINVEEAF